MKSEVETTYTLRNDLKQVFRIKAFVSKANSSGQEGAEITAVIRNLNDFEFTYVVEFGGEFCQTKKNFTPEMFLHTALSIVNSQIESHRHCDTRLKVHKTSGLTQTEPL